MERKKLLPVLLLAFVVLLGGASFLYDRLGQEVTPGQLAQQQPAGSAAESKAQTPLAPDFTVYDGEGNPVRLSDFIGKPVVLNFWASWCGPCKMEMPDFNESWLEQGEDIRFLMVNVTDGSRETVESASALIAAEGYQFPVFYDTQLEAARAYGARALPTTYFIDAQGHAVMYATGAITADILQQGIDMITGEDPETTVN